MEEVDAGHRLDLFLVERLGIPRGYARRLLGRERVQLGGRPAAKGTILRRGDRVQVRPFRHPDAGPPAAPEIAIRVLREADGLLAVDKPAGLPTHPFDCEERATVLNGLLARYPGLLGIGEGGVRSAVVHRLDTLTSGVLLFATLDESWKRVREEFAARRVQKRYLARIHGSLAHRQQVSLRLEPRGRQVRVVASGGHEAVSQLEPLRRLGDESLVEVRPLTGVMHQIRATLAHLGHPVVGDRLYGSSRELDRHLLHAVSIRVLEFEASAPVPARFYAA